VHVKSSHRAHVAVLTYDATAERLRGTIGTASPFDMRAFSGGSRGHKPVSGSLAKKYHHDEARSTTSRLATTREEKDGGGNYVQRGGTLPPGHYVCRYVQHHKSFGECLFLDPCRDAQVIHSPFALNPIVHGRGGFYIHGAGPKGSDGCIVPASDSERRRLDRAVKNFRGRVLLEVVNVSYALPAEQFDGALA